LDGQTFDLACWRHAFDAADEHPEAARAQPAGDFRQHTDVLLFVPLVESLQVSFLDRHRNRRRHSSRSSIARGLAALGEERVDFAIERFK
jgi:hypothetical protein